MAREPESLERVLDWTEGEMNELEPDAKLQWLWFSVTLAAMTVIALIVNFSRQGRPKMVATAHRNSPEQRMR